MSSVQASHVDDFNYPPPRRPSINWTLGNEAVASKTKLLQSLTTKQTNSTKDITGATTGTTEIYRAKQFTNNKPSLHSTGDIDGAQPKRHAKPEVHRVVDYSLNNKDIEHSFPESKLFTTPRVVNPMNPEYPLPKVSYRAPTPPKLVQESLRVEDIAGAKPCKKGITRKVPLNPVDYSDVSKPREPLRTTPGMALETKDVCAAGFKSQRPQQNPLEPVYNIFNVEVGAIEGNHPKRIRGLRNGATDNSLHTDDIDGARFSDFTPYPKNRREWKKTCDVGDIKELYPKKLSTFHKETNRTTDPVNPSYRLSKN